VCYIIFYPSANLAEVHNERKVSLMTDRRLRTAQNREQVIDRLKAQHPEKITDLRPMTFEQASVVGATYVVGHLITDISGAFYGATRNQITKIVSDGWTITMRQDPDVRASVSIVEPKLHALAVTALVALGWRVRDKQDHIVVLLPVV
jgi:hypothetical protein